MQAQTPCLRQRCAAPAPRATRDVRCRPSCWALGRYDEAHTVVADLLRDAPGIDPDIIVSLWARARAYGKAAAIMQSLPPNATPGWRDLTQWNCLRRAAPDQTAAEYLARASAAFEAWVAGVVTRRVPDLDRR